MKSGSMVLILAVLVGVSCAPLPSAPFVEGPLARYGGGGSGRISGLAVDAKSPEATPSAVTLVPVTPYTRVIESRIRSNFDPLRALDRRLDKYLRQTTPDSAGRFSFGGIPSGEYYVIFGAAKPSTTDVTMSDGTTVPEGTLDYRFIYAQVSVGAGQSVRVEAWRSP